MSIGEGISNAAIALAIAWVMVTLIQRTFLMALMTIKDKTRLQQDTPIDAHLARYERAFECRINKVNEVCCPFCGAAPGKNCFKYY